MILLSFLFACDLLGPPDVSEQLNGAKSALQKGELATAEKGFLEALSIDEKNIEVFRIFSPSNYKMGFLNKELRDNYNIELEKVKESGDYLRIRQKSIEITSKN